MFNKSNGMSPKRRYQSSSLNFGIGIGSQSPLTEGVSVSGGGGERSNKHHSSNNISTTASSSKRNNNNPIIPFTTPFYQGEKEIAIPPQYGRPHSTANTSRNKGNKTYRVRHHHQNHYEPVNSNFNALSQGIFGLPILNDYLRPSSTSLQHPPNTPTAAVAPSSSTTKQWEYEELGDTKLLDYSPPPENHFLSTRQKEGKPRMKTTLPSANTNTTSLLASAHKPGTPPPPSSSSYHLASSSSQQQQQQAGEEMDGILQVRPASRSSRTRPEQRSYGCSPSSPAGQRRNGTRRRRVQSTSGIPRASTAMSSSQEQLIIDTDHPGAAESLLQDCVTKLKSSDWEEVCSGFSKIQLATVEVPSQVKPFLRKIVWSGLPHFSSSRTKVSRSACQCFKRLFETQRRWMEGEGDKVFVKLLDLCGGPTNKFIQEESKEALVAAIQNTDGYKCLQLIEQNGAKHRNGNVREFSACLLGRIIDKVQVDRVMMSKEYAQKVVPMIVGFLKEGQLNTRLHAKDCLGKIFNHPDFNTVLHRHVSPESVRHVNDTLRKFRGGTGGGVIAGRRISH